MWLSYLTSLRPRHIWPGQRLILGRGTIVRSLSITQAKAANSFLHRANILNRATRDDKLIHNEIERRHYLGTPLKARRCEACHPTRHETRKLFIAAAQQNVRVENGFLHDPAPTEPWKLDQRINRHRQFRMLLPPYTAVGAALFADQMRVGLDAP